MRETRSEVTRLLLSWSDGDAAALDRLMPLVEAELREIASRYMEREDSGHTLQATALVNEVYLRLIDRRAVTWKNRAHFFGFAAQLMRRILVDHARGRQTVKRGNGIPFLPLDEAAAVTAAKDRELVVLDEALKNLAVIDPRQSQVVELRFFAGLTNEEIGEVLHISARTVKREWRTARLWLHRVIRQNL